MDLHLTSHPLDWGALRVFVDGALLGEALLGGSQHTSPGAPRTPDGVRAHCLERLAVVVQGLQEDLAHLAPWREPTAPTDAARRGAFWRGVEEGLGGVRAPHPFPRVPPLLPEYGASYERGYHHGDTLRRALGVIQAAPPRGETPSPAAAPGAADPWPRPVRDGAKTSFRPDGARITLAAVPTRRGQEDEA
jgi:hypothetical protein